MGKSTTTCKYVPSIERVATHDLIFMLSKANDSWPKDKMSLLLIDLFCHFSGERGPDKDMRTSLCAYWCILVHIGETGPDKDIMRTNLCAYWADLTFLCTAATFVQQQVVRN